MNRLLMILILMAFCAGSFAGVDCGLQKLKKLHVFSEKADSIAIYSNSLLVELGDEKTCQIGQAVLENTASSYESTLYMLMTAKIAGKKVRIKLGDKDLDPGSPSTHRIESVTLE